MSKMFRRIRSPRDEKSPGKDAGANSKTFTSGQLHVNHRRHKSDEVQAVQTVQTVQNVIYSEPVASPSNGPSARGANVAAALVDDGPPLPPRNRPASVGNSNQLRKQMSADDDPYYVAPADTLRNRRGLVVNPAVPGGDKGAALTKSERKQMQILEMAQSQKQVMSHTRTGSFGRLVDSSDYSTPWNLIQQQREKREKREKQMAANVAAEKQPQEPEVVGEREEDETAKPGPPPKPQRLSNRTKRAIVQQCLQNHEGDTIIPVSSPSPSSGLVHDVRSQSNSPTSPPVAADNDMPQTEREDDYDEPWDRRKFSRDIHQLSRSSRHGGQSGKWPQDGAMDGETHVPPTSVSPVSGSQRHYSPKMREKFRHGRGGSPQSEQTPRGIEGDHTSPHGGSETKSHRHKSEKPRRLSPQPEPKGQRSASEKGLGNVTGRDHRTESSPPLATDSRSWVSPGNAPLDHLREATVRSYSAGNVCENLPPSISPEVPSRAMSHSVPISRRRLPSPPLGAGVDHLEGRRYTQSHASSSPACEIEVTLPLPDQP